MRAPNATSNLFLIFHILMEWFTPKNPAFIHLNVVQNMTKQEIINKKAKWFCVHRMEVAGIQCLFCILEKTQDLFTKHMLFYFYEKT